jgi:hypothetical protein
VAYKSFLVGILKRGENDMIPKKTNIQAIHRAGRLLFLILPLLLLFTLMVYSENLAAEFYPPLDKRLENNTRITLDIDKVEEIISGNQYVVNGVIVSFSDKVSLREGEYISVKGIYRDGILQIGEYHIHKYYSIKFIISLLGLPVLLYYLRKEWKFNINTFCFKGR